MFYFSNHFLLTSTSLIPSTLSTSLAIIAASLHFFIILQSPIFQSFFDLSRLPSICSLPLTNFPFTGRVLTKTNITQYLNFITEFPCLLRMSRYPFGRYMCNLIFAIFRDYDSVKWRSMVPMEEDYLEIAYQGDKDLLNFYLEKVTAQDHNNDKLTLTLHLVGKPDYHLTNSFFYRAPPCL